MAHVFLHFLSGLGDTTDLAQVVFSHRFDAAGGADDRAGSHSSGTQGGSAKHWQEDRAMLSLIGEGFLAQERGRSLSDRATLDRLGSLFHGIRGAGDFPQGGLGILGDRRGLAPDRLGDTRHLAVDIAEETTSFETRIPRQTHDRETSAQGGNVPEFGERIAAGALFSGCKLFPWIGSLPDGVCPLHRSLLALGQVGIAGKVAEGGISCLVAILGGSFGGFDRFSGTGVARHACVATGSDDLVGGGTLDRCPLGSTYSATQSTTCQGESSSQSRGEDAGLEQLMTLLFGSLGEFLHFVHNCGAVPALESSSLGGELAILGSRTLDAAHAGTEGFAPLGSLAPWLQLGGFLSDGTLQVRSILAVVFFPKRIIETPSAGMTLGVVSQKRLLEFLHSLQGMGQLLKPSGDPEVLFSSLGAFDRSIDDFPKARSERQPLDGGLLSKKLLAIGRELFTGQLGHRIGRTSSPLLKEAVDYLVPAKPTADLINSIRDLMAALLSGS